MPLRRRPQHEIRMRRRGMHHHGAGHAEARDAEPERAGLRRCRHLRRGHCTLWRSPIFPCTLSRTADADMDMKTEHHAFQPRVEDDRLVRGAGQFADDIAQQKQAYAYFVRSPHAFARIVRIDTEAARAASGVLAVLTGADIEAARVGNVARHPPITGRNGSKLVIPHRPALAKDRVMHVGEPVAMIVAASQRAAQDAAELIAVEYEEFDPVINIRTATAPGASQLHPDAPGNIAVDWAGPSKDPDANAREVERIFAMAAHIAKVTHTHQRMVMATMEPRGG